MAPRKESVDDAHGSLSLHFAKSTEEAISMAKEVRITVRAIQRDKPDLVRLARTLIQQVLEQEDKAKSPRDRQGKKENRLDPPIKEAS